MELSLRAADYDTFIDQYVAEILILIGVLPKLDYGRLISASSLLPSIFFLHLLEEGLGVVV